VTAPQTLDRDGIAARIPHAGRMCLLDTLLSWSDEAVSCRATSHADAANPLRGPAGLHASAAIEYASQAMALHGALAAAPGNAPSAGFLAAARSVTLHVERLDTVDGPIVVKAQRLAASGEQAMYRFALEDGSGRALVDGRATVVLNTPLVPR
jgi:predicted hotdog family 3-hydroxylacyl-ACP dehydratase